MSIAIALVSQYEFNNGTPLSARKKLVLLCWNEISVNTETAVRYIETNIIKL